MKNIVFTLASPFILAALAVMINAAAGGRRLPTGPHPSPNAARRGIRVPDHLRTPPAVDVLVVCHGDACAPNTLIGSDGRWSGHVDLGALGLADRWADIAVAAMSTEWNYGPGYDRVVYDAYGIEPDEERIAYYRLLWDLG